MWHRQWAAGSPSKQEMGELVGQAGVWGGAGYSSMCWQLAAPGCTREGKRSNQALATAPCTILKIALRCRDHLHLVQATPPCALTSCWRARAGLCGSWTSRWAPAGKGAALALLGKMQHWPYWEGCSIGPAGKDAALAGVFIGVCPVWQTCCSCSGTAKRFACPLMNCTEYSCSMHRVFCSVQADPLQWERLLCPKSQPAPMSRGEHSAVVCGDEMIIFGGCVVGACSTMECFKLCYRAPWYESTGAPAQYLAVLRQDFTEV